MNKGSLMVSVWPSKQLFPLNLQMLSVLLRKLHFFGNAQLWLWRLLSEFHQKEGLYLSSQQDCYCLSSGWYFWSQGTFWLFVHFLFCSVANRCCYLLYLFWLSAIVRKIKYFYCPTFVSSTSTALHTRLPSWSSSQIL